MESAEFTHSRYEFFEKRRQDKIALVKSRRNDLVKKSERYEGPGGLSTGEKRALEEAAKQKPPPSRSSGSAWNRSSASSSRK